jgi:Holliday junction resolvase RusA-like endonuclease
MSCRRVTFDVMGIAQPQGSARMVPVKGREWPTITSDNRKLAAWRNDVAIEAHLVARDVLFVGPVSLTVGFFLPRPKRLARSVVAHVTKPDLDKLVRAIGDALEGILYTHDAQVVEIHATKGYAIGIDAPHVSITLEGESYDNGQRPHPGSPARRVDRQRRAAHCDQLLPR